MLIELQVKNLALIEEAQIEFGEGLNILTGETGAGKSIIIGSINMALGQKTSRDIIRNGADFAYVELIFQVNDPEKKKRLQSMDIEPDEDGLLIVSKKITPSRSISKINNETVTAARLREITSILIDIHGQHEHQSLLYKSKHLEILDAYIRQNSLELKKSLAAAYNSYNVFKRKLEDYSMDQDSRLREIDFCKFEIEEITAASLAEGEEEELSAQYRRMVNSQKITSGLSAAYQALQQDTVGIALRQVQDIAHYDNSLEEIQVQLNDADDILSQAGRAMSDYIESMNYDDAEFHEIEARLDQIRSLQAKYGASVSQILEQLEQKQRRLEELLDFDRLRQETEVQLKEAEEILKAFCEELSDMRRQAARELTAEISQALEDLNFLDVNCVMEFTRLDHYSSEGWDQVEFLISTNPGEPLKPLGMVASGGELSRIMLAVKTVLADSDDIPTLIFDEIDTGISGRTAQRVSEKLKIIARGHQVICITHLPQIASMADTHFEIAKAYDGQTTRTTIRPLDEKASVEELARLLGGAEITDTVLNHAREMKEMAKSPK